MEKQPTKEQFYFFDDDGETPNSKFPLTIYTAAIPDAGEDAAKWFEKKFSGNGWTNSWRWGVYDYHHYHNNTHEVLGVFQGTATIRFGGVKGEELQVEPGNVVVIPAGVSHKCITHSEGFQVVGAYPDGKEPNMTRAEASFIEESRKLIPGVEVPPADPLYGKNDGIVKSWKEETVGTNFTQLSDGSPAEKIMIKSASPCQ